MMSLTTMMYNIGDVVRVNEKYWKNGPLNNSELDEFSILESVNFTGTIRETIPYGSFPYVVVIKGKDWFFYQEELDPVIPSTIPSISEYE